MHRRRLLCPVLTVLEDGAQSADGRCRRERQQPLAGIFQTNRAVTVRQFRQAGAVFIALFRFLAAGQEVFDNRGGIGGLRCWPSR